MPKVTNEEGIKEKLEYLGLNLEKIPKFFKEYKDLEYRPLKAYEENTYKVYKYIPISKIQILLTPKNRLNTIKEKYGNASSIYKYLEPQDSEDIIKHTTFLKMLKETKIEQIEQIEQEQKLLNKKIPFKVKFKENYSWQIYYSDTTNMYFMIVPTEDLEYATFFYLLKKQIECDKTKKEETIFVPICYENYSEKYLKKSEISDIEKYLWFFTKNLPNVYEVYDKKDNLNLYIVGDTIVYDDMIAPYSIKLKDEEEASKLYKLLKALFILGTELSHHFKFKVKIDRFGGLQFEYNSKIIEYDNMFSLLNDEYGKAKEQILTYEKERKNLEKKLKNLKNESIKKNEEYLVKEKQIATYLECKKTFFGRVKYFFKAKKLKQNKKVDIEEKESKESIEEKIVDKEENIEFVTKEYYTIEDISKIYKELDKLDIMVKNLRLDVQALKTKINSMETKIENANLYIAEIDKYEKNIFEFWKFTNKDESKLLNQGTGEILNIKTKIEKVYKYKEDLESIGTIVDKNQRSKFSDKDLNAIYLLSTNVLEALNNIQDKEFLKKSLEVLKKEAENERILFDEKKIDIFGNTKEDSTKMRMLGGKKHRETAKDKLKILSINKDTKLEEYKTKLVSILEQIKDCFEKAQPKISIGVYIVKPEKIKLEGFTTFYIDPNEAMKQYEDEKEIELHKINLKEDTKVIYFSNSVYFDNYNRTLPLGMNMGTKGIIDLNKIKFTRPIKDNFRIGKQINEFDVEIKKINTYEYNILEEENDK